MTPSARNRRRAPATALLFALLLLTPALHARFTLEQVMGSPVPSNLTAAERSPSVAWVFDAKGVRNIWVAEGPEYRARRVTNYAADDGQQVSGLRWTPDAAAIVYVRGGQGADQTFSFAISFTYVGSE
jgi:hypothetical protein